MAATKLDAAGTQKVKTLEEALQALQTIHGMVERMAMDVKAQRSSGILPQQIKRLGGNLQGQLKGQFGLLADQVAQMVLAAGRGGSETVRVRVLREFIGQLRTALEINVSKVKKEHAVDIELAAD